jgi:hypothetical protein
VWLKAGDPKTMSRMDESIDHQKGRFSLTGWAKSGSLPGMLFLQPVSIGVFTVNFD